MVKLVLLIAVVLQISIAISSEGLTRSLAELTAFLIAIALVFALKSDKPESTSDQRDKSTTII
ncbi:hypothetical protein ACEWBT_02455 [Vibrio parahaemolyticus]|uniref:hypothetical protein n=1 Tax=Vibrio parahaemolyticus TaxID=670 RepID=UPI0006A64083|nr:hypothetical protein [Vibrio parahaemolyticus]EJG0951298.1 hypothetical protein [Vibrio parahaemolyticus O1:K58]EHV9723393.1 hypothetical protein [Vibrio parahaemolyticus]EKO7416501.1 hypothetical protein [Vibrio parahaemolyticus]EKQ5899575.1 hypothetical protein [Vibrio parahaemolyticus]KOE75494.1 O-succinylbenzoic acid--CoA ligase [Vibrio parahaemolyticus]